MSTAYCKSTSYDNQCRKSPLLTSHMKEFPRFHTIDSSVLDDNSSVLESTSLPPTSRVHYPSFESRVDDSSDTMLYKPNLTEKKPRYRKLPPQFRMLPRDEFLKMKDKENNRPIAIRTIPPEQFYAVSPKNIDSYSKKKTSDVQLSSPLSTSIKNMHVERTHGCHRLVSRRRRCKKKIDKKPVFGSGWNIGAPKSTKSKRNKTVIKSLNGVVKPTPNLRNKKKTSNAPVYSTARTGCLSSTPQTRINYELVNGQFVFRKVTPVVNRPSPSKNKPCVDNGDNFLSVFPNVSSDRGNCEGVGVPSPVKCVNEDSTMTEESFELGDVTRIIDKLASDEEFVDGEDKYSVYLTVEDLAVSLEEFRTPAEQSGTGNSLYGDIRDIFAHLDMSKTSVDRHYPVEPSISETRASVFVDLEVHSKLPMSSTESGCKRHVTRKNSSVNPTLIQTTINAGQRRQGATLCTNCGCVYSAGNSSDQKLHESQCDPTKGILLLRPSKPISGLIEVALLEEAKLQVLMAHMTTLHKGSAAYLKIIDVLSVIDKELGISGGLQQPTDKVFLLLDLSSSVIIGCLSAEFIDSSDVFCVSRFNQALSSLTTQDLGVVCGVSRLWVLASHRRSGGATTLMNVMRQWMILPEYLSRDQVAFSDPTPRGADFAEKYTGDKHFAVYSSFIRQGCTYVP